MAKKWPAAAVMLPTSPRKVERVKEALSNAFLSCFNTISPTKQMTEFGSLG